MDDLWNSKGEIFLFILSFQYNENERLRLSSYK